MLNYCISIKNYWLGMINSTASLSATMAQAGLGFDVTVANAHIGPWLMQVADQRIHGTTGQKPSVLLDQERHEFLP